MASATSRHLEQLRATARSNELKTIKLLTQSRKARSTSKVELRKRHQLEKKVVNSFTELVDAKKENDHKNTLVFNVLVRKIKEHLMESGRCADEKSCDATARKMASFVSDVMKETYKTQRIPRRSSLAKVDRKEKRSSSKEMQRGSLTKLRTGESLPIIPEEPSNKVKKISRASGSNLDHRKDHRATTPTKKLSSNNQTIAKPSSKPTEPNKISKVSKAKGDSAGLKTEKDQLNSWLNDVSERTKKWTEWIQDTVEKAESTKSRVQKGEDFREVSKDWKRFMNAKKDESRNLKESFSDIWKEKDYINEACRRRGQESIQNWLLKNKLNVRTNDLSNISVRTASSNESLYSVWSSRGPSSIFDSETEYSRLKQLGMLP